MPRPIDRNAVDRLVVEHLPAALRMALRLAGDPSIAEDLVQETLLRVLRDWRCFRGGSSFKTWMLQILINVDRDRRRRLRPYQPLDDAELELAAHEPSAAEFAAGNELNEELKAAVDRLPERQREVALLAWGEGCSPVEIAAILNIAESNVYATIHLARKRIARSISPSREGRG
jgi:RNA polymerase sigma-70 factor (ECF subfamily)